MEISEVFLTFLITSVIGMLLAIGRMFYKSKCVKFDCLCFHIERDIEHELQDIEAQSTKNNDTKL